MRMLTYSAYFHKMLFRLKALFFSAGLLIGLPKHSFVDTEVAIEKLEGVNRHVFMK
jgi:hypothetical protein